MPNDLKKRVERLELRIPPAEAFEAKLRNFCSAFKDMPFDRLLTLIRGNQGEEYVSRTMHERDGIVGVEWPTFVYLYDLLGGRG